jgi:GNAT superfamily N-acetyltransferase
VDFSFADIEPGDPRLVSEIFPVLVELRTHLTAESLLAVYAAGYPQGLRFTGAYPGGSSALGGDPPEPARCLGVAGWRIMDSTFYIRKLYVDDLVTSAATRSTGVGSALIAELARRARAAGCFVVDLDSGLQRGDAHRFYFRERMSIAAFHFALEL